MIGSLWFDDPRQRKMNPEPWTVDCGDPVTMHLSETVDTDVLMAVHSKYTGDGDGPVYFSIHGETYPGCVR